MENLNNIITNLNNKLIELFKDENTGHDINHLNRVYKNAINIQKIEGGDLYIVSISALIHDLHRLMSNQQKHYVTPKLSILKESIVQTGTGCCCVNLDGEK